MAPLWTLLGNNSLSTLMVLQSLQRMCSVTICRSSRGISRRLEPLERIYGCVPLADPVASLVDCPTLAYIERETVGTKTPPNPFKSAQKPQVEHKEYHKGVNFFPQSNPIRFPPIQSPIISPLRWCLHYKGQHRSYA